MSECVSELAEWWLQSVRDTKRKTIKTANRARYQRMMRRRDSHRAGWANSNSPDTEGMANFLLSQICGLRMIR